MAKGVFRRFRMGMVAGVCAVFASHSLLAEVSVPTLSSEAKISVLTMWAGHEIYLAFGHSAFRVKDPARDLDQVFNYGTFDLSDPLFIPKFVYGELRYSLTDYPFKPYFQYDKRVENRRWVEQELNLTPIEATELYRFLVNNALPENKYYIYDFIRDNCSTRISDALIHVFGDRVVFDESEALTPHKTYRDMLDEFVGIRPMYQFLFYLVLGMASDREVSALDAVWLPQYLLRALDAATISRNGAIEELVSATTTLYDPENPSDYGSPWFDPAFLLWPVAALVIFLVTRNILRLRRTGQIPRQILLSRISEWLFFFLLGSAGLIVWYLNFLSVHTAVKENLNVLWMWPTHLVASFFLLRAKRPVWLGWYMGIAAFISLVPVLAFLFWAQGLHPTMIPLLLTVVARGVWCFVVSRASLKVPTA